MVEKISELFASGEKGLKELSGGMRMFNILIGVLLLQCVHWPKQQKYT